MHSNPTNKPYAKQPERFRSSSPARRAVRLSPRSRGISPALRPLAIIIAALALPLAARGATPTPHPATRIDLTKIQSKSLLPKHAEHTDYLVQINKLGQVTKITGAHRSDNPTFNAQTAGNAIQTFIRTPDGHVILGTYRLTYDYDPKTERVRRDVSLVRQGGVNPDAKGAAAKLIEEAEAQERRRAATPVPVDPRTLPDLKSISAPTPRPKAS